MLVVHKEPALFLVGITTVLSLESIYLTCYCSITATTASSLLVVFALWINGFGESTLTDKQKVGLRLNFGGFYLAKSYFNLESGYAYLP